MVCILEIILLVVGLLALVSGKLKLGKNRVAVGAGARIAGVVFLLPLPLAFGVGFLMGMDRTLSGKAMDSDFQLMVSLIELGISVGCAVIGFGLAAAASVPAEQAERNREKAQRPPSPAPVVAEPEPLWALPVEEPVEALCLEPQPIRPPVARPARPGPAKRPPAVVRASRSPVVWWVVGGLAVCFVLCMIPVGGLLMWWYLSTSTPARPTGPVAVSRPPDVQVDPANEKQPWEEQKPPQFEMPPGAAPPPDMPAGMGPPPGAILPPPGNVEPPPPPPFKPIIIAQPAAPHLDLQPPKLTQEKVVRRLPSPISDVAVGGGGRFLILHLARDNKLAIFDVNRARVIKYLPFAGSIRFAAGMDALVVALLDQNLLERWSLTTFEREHSVPLARQERVQSLTMGSASNGPLLVRQNGGPALTFFDLRTLQPLNVQWGEHPGGQPDGRIVRASANGKVFVLHGWGPVTLLWDDGRVTIADPRQGGGRYALPSADGKAVFTDAAIYDEYLKPAIGAANVKMAMPATHGRYYLAGHSLYILGDSRPLLTLPAEKPEPGTRDLQQFLPRADASEDMTPDKRGYFLPDARLLISIPMTDDRLILRRFDLDAALEKLGGDYLFVTSQPPARAKKGAAYRYQLAVRSKRGGVKYRLESGPKGMAVSDAGLLTWDVPAAAAEAEVDVIVSVGDKSGREVFHTFRVLPGDRGEDQAPVIDKREPVKVAALEPEAPEDRPLLPPIRPGPAIRPPHLAADRVVKKLPSTVTDVAVGGGGRYLILHLPQQRKLAVFDVNEANITGYIPLAGDKVKFTAGRDKLMVALADQGILQRWSLTTLEREATAPLRVQHTLSLIAMGSASDGPLLVAGAQGTANPELFFLDISTFGRLPIEKVGQGHIHIMEGDGVRASRDGRVFGIWRNYSSPPGLQTLVLEGEEAKASYQHFSVGHVTPGPDGKVIYTAAGRYTSRLEPLGDPRKAAAYYLPALEGDYYLTVEATLPSGADRRRPDALRGPVRAAVRIHQAGKEAPLATLSDVDVPGSIHRREFNREPLPADRRLLFIPSAGLLVSIPTSSDRLLLHRIDLLHRAKEPAPPPDKAQPGSVQLPQAKPAASGIKPPSLAREQVELRLPSTVLDAVVGGGGRYLVLRLSGLRSLAVFDVNAGRVVRWLPIDDDEVHFAAGQDKLLAALAGRKSLERWDLATGRREAAAPLPVKDPLLALSMGSASHGPLLIAASTGVTFVDPATLRSFTLPEAKRRELPPISSPRVRASADGQVFTFQGLVGSNPRNTFVLTVHGGRVAVQRAEGFEGNILVPGGDGRLLYSAFGALDSRLRPVAPAGEANAKNSYLPAEQGSYYLMLEPDGDKRGSRLAGLRPIWGVEGGAGAVSFFLAGEQMPLARLEDVEGVYAENVSPGVSEECLAHDRRIHYIPDAHLLVSIPTGEDRLVLRRFDIEAALEKSSIDYLFVASEPPTRARKGTAYRCPLAVRSRSGGVRCRIESGPKGMTVTDAGLLTWDVPADLADSQVDVILALSDKSGQEAFHSFRIFTDDRGVDLMPAAGGVPPEPQQPGPPAKRTLPPLRPAPVIRPPQLSAERVEHKLSSPVADVAVGGAGRYLILHQPQEHRLAVFDVSAAKITGTIPLTSDNVKFTAGRDKLVVVQGSAKAIERWDLATRKREATAPLDLLGYKLAAVAMGSASDGPILVAASTQRDTPAGTNYFLDLSTLELLRLRQRGESFLIVRADETVRASANGRVFTLWGSENVPPGTYSFVLDGREARAHRSSDRTGYVVPGPAGSILYTAAGRYTSHLQARGGLQSGPHICLPAAQDRYLLALGTGLVVRHGRKVRDPLTVYLTGHDRPLAELPEVNPPARFDPWLSERMSIDKRIHLIPSARLLVTIPDTNDRLVLHRFDVEAALEKSGIDYLFVASQPPVRAKKGAAYRYPLAVKSKRGGVKYRLEHGPKGMTVSDTGLVTWDVPKDISESQIDVILTISDRSGREVFHTFAILPGDQGEEPPVPAADAPPPPPRKEPAAREPRSLKVSRGHVHALTFTPDGRELLSAGDDGRLRRWAVADGKELASFDPHPRVSMFSVGVSADGKLLLTSGLDRTARLWDAATNRLRTTCTCTDRIPHVHAALSADGKTVATGTNQVRLWDAATGREIGPLQGRPCFIEALTFSPDGKRLACTGSGNTVKLWDVAGRKELASLTGHTQPVMGLAFSADGKTLASASADRTIKLWDPATNKELRTLKGHADPLSSVAFSPDGALLVSGAGGIRFDGGHLGEVKLWDAATGKPLADLRGHTDGVSSVAFSPDGKTVASAARDRTVRLWDVSAYAGR